MAALESFPPDVDGELFIKPRYPLWDRLLWIDFRLSYLLRRVYAHNFFYSSCC